MFCLYLAYILTVCIITILIFLETPVKLAHPVDQLMRAVFTEDNDKLERYCQEVAAKTKFVINLASRAARCTDNTDYRGYVEFK